MRHGLLIFTPSFKLSAGTGGCKCLKKRMSQAALQGKTDQKQQSCIKLSYSIRKEISEIWAAKHRERLPKEAEKTHPQRPSPTQQGPEHRNPTPAVVSL